MKQRKGLLEKRMEDESPVGQEQLGAIAHCPANHLDNALERVAVHVPQAGQDHRPRLPFLVSLEQPHRVGVNEGTVQSQAARLGDDRLDRIGQ